MSYIEPEQNQLTDFLKHRNFLVKHKFAFPSLNPDQVMDFDVVSVLWSDGGKLIAKRKKAHWTCIRPQSSLSYLDRTRDVTQLSRRGRNSRSVTEKSARRDGRRRKTPSLLARTLSWGRIIFRPSRAPLCCLDSLLECLSRYFGVFLRIFPIRLF